MKESIYHSLNDENYLGIITIFDNKLTLNVCLSKYKIASTDDRKVIIDLPLKNGLDECRFSDARLDSYGNIMTRTIQNIKLNSTLKRKADDIVVAHMDIVRNSSLKESKKKFFEDYKNNKEHQKNVVLSSEEK